MNTFKKTVAIAAAVSMLFFNTIAFAKNEPLTQTPSDLGNQRICRIVKPLIKVDELSDGQKIEFTAKVIQNIDLLRAFPSFEPEKDINKIIYFHSFKNNENGLPIAFVVFTSSGIYNIITTGKDFDDRQPNKTIYISHHKIGECTSPLAGDEIDEIYKVNDNLFLAFSKKGIFFELKYREENGKSNFECRISDEINREGKLLCVEELDEQTYKYLLIKR